MNFLTLQMKDWALALQFHILKSYTLFVNNKARNKIQEMNCWLGKTYVQMFILVLMHIFVHKYSG